MSLLTIISDPEQGAAALCGLSSPSSIINSSDPNVPVLLRLANQEGRELAERHDWQELMVDYTFASLATEVQTSLPTDYDRFLEDAELWNRSTSQRYSGPTDQKVWGQIKGMGITSGSAGWWRLLGGQLYITPAPSAGDTLAIPYQSKNWVRPVSGSDSDHFGADTDTTLIPERLITLGIVWRYKASKGRDYAEDMATYERAVERATSRNKGLKVLTPPARRVDPLSYSWPGTISS